MTYPQAAAEQIHFFREHGWIVVDGAIPQGDLDDIERGCERLITEKETLAYDWAWDAKETKAGRSFRIVQGTPAKVWPEIADQPFRAWLAAYASSLMGLELEFWYDQFLAKPPGNSVPTYWHQDEGYWGRNLLDKGITCWIPLHDVDARNGCMHFIDRGHLDGVLPHRSVEGVQSDLLTCDVDEARTVVCPIPRGAVTFHHSKMPHMTTANLSQAWRKALSNHLQAVGAGGEGDHYAWRVCVNQRTGERSRPGR
jgi:phytanoyl-CoA hydroxylase